MGRVRPFTISDIPDVVALRRRSFAESAHSRAEDLADYFERIFFDNPWKSANLPSLVHAEDTGRVTGFLGVVPRRAVFDGEPIDVAVCTQFMVDQEAGGFAGVQLVKTLLEGQQDLAFADVSNDPSRKIWEALGGSVSPVHSLTWTQPIRPARFRAAEAVRGLPSRMLVRALRPALSLVDAVAARRRPPPQLEPIPLTPELIAAQSDSVLAGVMLRPSYGAHSTRWLLDQLELRREWGNLRGVALRADSVTVAGWFLYYMNRGGTGEVVQVAASSERYPEVLQALFADAWSHGLVALRGRGDPQLLPCLDPGSARIARNGTWVLVHSRRREIMRALTSGDAFFSRLEGEWWLSF